MPTLFRSGKPAYNSRMSELPDPLPTEPMALFAVWLSAARHNSGLPNPEAMALATSDGQGGPSARIVLCKSVDVESAYLVFYTNYQSAKGRAIEEHPAVAANFHWDGMSRQVRITGLAVRSPAAESDAYFASRDRESQLGAWASRQSTPVATRAELLDALERARQRFSNGEVPRPPHWGGYRIWVESLELWSRGDARLHDRVRWSRKLRIGAEPDTFTASAWSATRLQP